MDTLQSFITAGLILLSGLFKPQYHQPNVGGVSILETSPSPTSSPVPTSSPTPTLTPAPTSTPTPLPTPTHTPMPLPVYSSEDINHLIDQFADLYSIDANVLRHIAVCESGLNPHAKNLTYGGLFQFSPGSWSTHRYLLQKDPNPDLRYDAKEAIQTAAFAISIGRISLWPTCGQTGKK